MPLCRSTDLNLFHQITAFVYAFSLEESHAIGCPFLIFSYPLTHFSTFVFTNLKPENLKGYPPLHMKKLRKVYIMEYTFVLETQYIELFKICYDLVFKIKIKPYVSAFVYQNKYLKQTFFIKMCNLKPKKLSS